MLLLVGISAMAGINGIAAFLAGGRGFQGSIGVRLFGDCLHLNKTAFLARTTLAALFGAGGICDHLPRIHSMRELFDRFDLDDSAGVAETGSFPFFRASGSF